MVLERFRLFQWIIEKISLFRCFHAYEICTRTNFERVRIPNAYEFRTRKKFVRVRNSCTYEIRTYVFRREAKSLCIIGRWRWRFRRPSPSSVVRHLWKLRLRRGMKKQLKVSARVLPRALEKFCSLSCRESYFLSWSFLLGCSTVRIRDAPTAWDLPLPHYLERSNVSIQL